MLIESYDGDGDDGVDADVGAHVNLDDKHNGDQKRVVDSPFEI
jgi:hypothetical protein